MLITFLQENGRQISTGRWILLKHGHFLLRAAHTIQWVENPLKASHIGLEDKMMPSIVWDWRSTAERWRWAIYEMHMGKVALVVEVEGDCREIGPEESRE